MPVAARLHCYADLSISATLLCMTKSTSRAHERAPKAARPESQPTASAILADGSLVEMIHDPDAGRTGFMRSTADVQSAVTSVDLPDGRVLVPFSAQNNLLTHSVVLFPSGVDEYGSRSDLIVSVRRFLHAYCDLSPLFEQIAAHYVLLSWVGDVFNELPYLRVQGSPGSGKTRFLLTIGSLCYKPIFASGASTVSPLFRILDSMQGTLVLDEADFRLSDERADVVKILNHGTVRGFPVLRAEQNGATKEFNPHAYHVFGPKIVATRNGFDDAALESRFITERLGTRTLRHDVPISLGPEHAAEARRLRNQLLLFRFRSRAVTRRPEVLDRRLEPRLLQTFGPLLAVIDDEALRAAVADLALQYQRQLGVDRGHALEGQILEVVQAMTRDGAVPTVKKLAEAFGRRYGRDVQVPVTPTWFGIQLRKKLGIVTQRRNTGFVIAASEAAKLAVLYERYGLAGDDGTQGAPDAPDHGIAARPA